MLHLACVTSPPRDHAIIPHSPQVKLRSSFLDRPFFIGTNSTNLFDRVGDNEKRERSDRSFVCVIITIRDHAIILTHGKSVLSRKLLGVSLEQTKYVQIVSPTIPSKITILSS
jgi:hypothetical protein